MKCGLLGRKLGHSYSPQIHAHLGQYSYCLFEKEPEELEDFLRNGDFTGLNVTIPYKKAVIPYLDELSQCAEKLGAVNTIVRRSDGKLVGHNTDYFGFSAMVKESGLSVCGKKALILGSGGASVTAAAVLNEMGARVVVISRTGENNYSNLYRHEDAALLVNTTPVGMYPQVGERPVSPEQFPDLEGVLDLIYNPARTQLLLEAEDCGLTAVNGLLMLVAQAKKSAEWFTGKKISDEVISRVHDSMTASMENIVLIGMPGSGKSTVGEILSRKLGRTLVDADEQIIKEAGCSIPEIFANFGEDGFRALETKVLARLGKESGLIIATGGGCVTRQENYPLLHQNGKLLWLQRDLDKLPTQGRPLSQKGSLEDMYRVRRVMYWRFADYIFNNNGTPEDTADAIIKYLGGTL